MEGPVPQLELQPSVDIKVYIDPSYAPVICKFGFYPALHLTNAALVGTSLEGTRSAQDFLGLVKMIIRPDDFHLKSLKEGHVVSTEGTIGPGDYVISTQVLSYLHSPYQHFLPHSWS